ncbi:MAG: isocitrate lyase/phosphoenolpyruvate mutase family protein [Alphaproteobacteria bacterium]|nr:isocitrate lyase/phosphoenolpyruvate mutase family protein [Alphaproteobacteria bacterium]
MDREINRRFRERLARRDALLVPGAANALAARVIADLGFEAVYVSGAGVTNTFLGIPDLGFIGLPELAQHTAAIREAVDLPLIVDADTGFGNALNVRHTIRTLERAGASAIQLEDQVMPKRCGHFAGKEVVGAAEMAAKVRAAVDARRDPNLLIIARTDARAVEGFEAALERAGRYIDAGADVTFVEAPESVDEIDRIPRALAVPQLINMVVGGKTPILDHASLKAKGYAIVLYANAALQGAVRGMQAALGALKTNGRLDETPLVASFKERQRLVQKPLFDALDRKYAAE